MKSAGAVCYLPLEHDSVGLTLGADATRPRRMLSTTGLYLAADVLEDCKLASDKTWHHYDNQQHGRTHTDQPNTLITSSSMVSGEVLAWLSL